MAISKKCEGQVEKATPSWFAAALADLVERRELSSQRMRAMLQDLIADRCGEVEAAALLVALRAKGETAGELATAALVLREHMVRFETGHGDVLDTCGTGGDETGTFNISTATAVVVAGAGVPVVKHGNRAVSSTCGSADVLAALGVSIQEDLDWVERCLDTAGMAFCFAQHFHPALRHLAALRKRLKVRTLFNCLGPLANPAGAAFQLLGVGRPEQLDPMAGALARLGVRHAFVVCGEDGLDEVSLSSPTLVREVRKAQVTVERWTPDDFGLAPCTLADLRVTGPEQSATVIRHVLDGNAGPATDVVIANAATALLAADRVASLCEGVARARETLQAGLARRVLERLQTCSVAAVRMDPAMAEDRQ